MRWLVAKVNRPNAPQVYRTPRALLDAIEQRFGRIEFDAACRYDNAVAVRGYYYPEVDALERDWNDDLAGPRTHPQREPPLVYTNPPFALSGKFAAKHASYVGRSLLLVPASVDSNWFAEYVWGRALVLPLSPRVTFVDQPTPINRALMLCAFNVGMIGFEPWRWAPKKERT